jgi:stage II sporulation protein D
MAAATAAAPQSVELQPPEIRVLLGRGRLRSPLSGRNLRWGAIPRGTNRAVAWTGPEGGEGIEFLCDARFKSIVISQAQAGRAPRTWRYQAGELEVQDASGLLQWDGKRYPARLRIRPDAELGCEIVNHVPFETYLEGLVNHEFSSKWAPAAVEAQVIAARTYALHQVREARRDPKRRYDIESTERDQVYGGSERVDEGARLAVARTRGVILVDAQAGGVPALKLTRAAPIRGAHAVEVQASHTQALWERIPRFNRPESLTPLKAYYHSTCGGGTELPEKIWGKKASGFKRRVKCSSCGDSPKASWQLPLSLKELSELLSARGPGSKSKPLRLEGLKIASWTAGGRADRLELLWRGADSKSAIRQEISAQEFRMRVGAGRVLSTWFGIYKDKGGNLILQGRGYGHGVGLCQWGAKNQGARGARTDAILSHYYPDSRLVRVW